MVGGPGCCLAITSTLLLLLLLLDDVRIVVEGLIELQLLHLFAILDFLVLRYTLLG